MLGSLSDEATAETVAPCEIDCGEAADQLIGFGYNAAGQLAARSMSNDAYVSNTAAAVSRNYSVNRLNQYSGAGQSTFGYDLNGNLDADSGPAGSTSFVYDAENRLVTASGARTATLVYDPLGRLFSVTGASSATQFLYDGDALVVVSTDITSAGRRSEARASRDSARGADAILHLEPRALGVGTNRQEGNTGVPGPGDWRLPAEMGIPNMHIWNGEASAIEIIDGVIGITPLNFKLDDRRETEYSDRMNEFQRHSGER